MHVPPLWNNIMGNYASQLNVQGQTALTSLDDATIQFMVRLFRVYSLQS